MDDLSSCREERKMTKAQLLKKLATLRVGHRGMVNRLIAKAELREKMEIGMDLKEEKKKTKSQLLEVEDRFKVAMADLMGMAGDLAWITSSYFATHDEEFKREYTFKLGKLCEKLEKQIVATKKRFEIGPS